MCVCKIAELGSSTLKRFKFLTARARLFCYSEHLWFLYQQKFVTFISLMLVQVFSNPLSDLVAPSFENFSAFIKKQDFHAQSIRHCHLQFIQK